MLGLHLVLVTLHNRSTISNEQEKIGYLTLHPIFSVVTSDHDHPYVKSLMVGKWLATPLCSTQMCEHVKKWMRK